MYNEDDYLQLSGIQHFVFCRRQWALIHVEQQWAENYRTVDGELLHSRAHDGALTENRGSLRITRAMPLRSARLGISGQCDVLEFHAEPGGITLPGQPGTWRLYPVEYKRGKPKEHEADALQLCAQALCLEEMLCCEIPEGALYYGEPHRRTTVAFTQALRQQVEDCLAEMHELAARGYTPKVKPKKGCTACSLKELCLPRLLRGRSAAAYLREHLEEEA